MGSPPARGPADYWSPGDWNIYCSICGSKLKFSQAVRNWQGQWRHIRCDEPRHPQDFVHARNAPEMEIPFPQKMGEDYIYVCSGDDSKPMPGVGVPGCMLPGSGLICTAEGLIALPGSGTPGCMIPGNGALSFVCYPDGMSAMPGLAIPGCSVPDVILLGCTADGSSGFPGFSIPGCMFPSGSYCTPAGMTSTPTYATPGCSIPGS